MLLILWFVAVLVAIAAAGCWLIGSLLVRPTSAEAKPAASPARDLTIITDDGLAIAATYRPGRHDAALAILMLHGNGSSRRAIDDNAAWFTEHGFATLTIDFRGHGASATAIRSFGLHEARDARAAFDWLKRQQGGAPVAVIGISLGGAAALLGEAGPLPADAMVLQAVYPDIRRAIRNRIASLTGAGPARVLEPLLSYQSRLRYGVWPTRLSPVAALPSFKGAILVIGGDEDRYTPTAETEEIYRAAVGSREVWHVPLMDHAGVSDIATDAYRVKVLDFLCRAIGAP